MAGFIVGLAGGLGIIQNNVTFKKTEFSRFVRDLPPGSVINTSAKNPGFFAGGIRAVTGMPWDHSLMYVGRSAGNMIREKFPELLGKRTARHQGKEYPLNQIPKEAVLHEIVESGLHIEANALDKYNTDKTSLEAWSRPYTQQQLEMVLFNLYLVAGMPYDISEILWHIGMSGNPNESNHPVIIKTEKGDHVASFTVCSSTMGYALKRVELIPNWDGKSPGGLHKYFVRTPQWSRRLFNCVAGV